MFNPLNELTRITHHNFAVSDAPEISGDWLDSLSSHMQVKNVDYKPEMKIEVSLHSEECDSPYEIYDMDRSQSPDAQKDMECKPELKEVPGCEKECDSPDESDEDQSFTYEKKPKNKIHKPNYKQLDLECGWLDCNYRSTNLDHFVGHVSAHIPHLEVKENQNHEGSHGSDYKGHTIFWDLLLRRVLITDVSEELMPPSSRSNGVYACLWESCGFESFDSNETVRHVNFHSYHTKIKCIGSNIVAQSELLGCTFSPVGKNLVPNLPHAFTCSWDDCEQTFNNSQMYFRHMQTHVHHNPHGHKVAGGVPCSWHGCKSVFRSVYKLAEHVRSHTQEKLVGCPTCGGLFANKVKFVDHCKRQVPLELQGYQCSHCSKFYASKRLLRDHMCHHSNAYKCTFCAMTCPSPSGLAAHIRYKHVDFKPFKCNLCEFTAKTQYDLKCHLNTHSSEPRYCCEEKGCTFSCRSGYGLRKHYHKSHHRDDEPMYCCHVCDNLFQRGSLLTRHLMVQHSIFWPPGHSRFRYKCDDDGYFRLQRLKGAQKMKQSPPHSTQPLCGSSRYNLRRISGRRFEVTVAEHEDDDGYFRLQRLKGAQKMKQSPPHSTQPLCGSSRYNLRRVSGRRFEVTVAEHEDDDGYFRLQRLKGAQKMKQSPPHSTQPLCGSSRYNLRRVSGRRFEVTVAEHEDDDGYFRLQRLKGAQKMKQSPPHSTQPLCGSSRYNLRRVSGRRFEVTVAEHEDDP